MSDYVQKELYEKGYENFDEIYLGRLTTSKSPRKTSTCLYTGHTSTTLYSDHTPEGFKSGNTFDHNQVGEFIEAAIKRIEEINKPKFNPIRVKLNLGHSAIVNDSHVVVGCQNFSFEFKRTHISTKKECRKN